ncbi:MAG TPA: hypothetical protein H9717_00630 [Candidatus Eisenbergiella merdipullorum]|uniref:Uncharacterized protein n=1 Tax=Candidatus Eisenbergiella merdipullorum TaxID=2838553 RepID=A0A9D2I2D8_9FIRM|nr:hypothetical protein [Candidatus Eisenbergiella merdipullorum]
MGRKIKRFLLLTAVSCFLFGNLTIFAADTPFVEVPQNKIEVFSSSDGNSNVNLLSSPSLSACVVGLKIANDGLYITFDTTATQTANEIGVKNVVLQEKTWYGWKDMPISNYCTYNSDVYSGDIVYTLATKGTTYRVKCTHYAKFGSTELTLDNTSSELKYN